MQRESLRCDVCRKSYQSALTLDTHLESAKHKERVLQQRKPVSPSKASPNDKKSRAEEQAAEALAAKQPARAAQALYDAGMQHARAGR